jgi:hypothetical protein
VRGQERLNLAFVANLFNNHPSLDPPKENIVIEMDNIEESREEKVSHKCILLKTVMNIMKLF